MGCFWQPSAVLCDTAFFDTLPEETFADGVGEAIKYGAIRDAQLFEQMRGDFRRNLLPIVARCIAIKAAVVEADERDTGERMVLNFGHTLGHAVETVQGYGGLRHGEAVALGRAVITRMSEDRGLTQVGTSARLDTLLEALGLPTHVERLDASALLSPMRLDKKNLGQTLRIILLKSIGQCYVENTSVDWFASLENYL